MSKNNNLKERMKNTLKNIVIELIVGLIIALIIAWIFRRYLEEKIIILLLLVILIVLPSLIINILELLKLNRIEVSINDFTKRTTQVDWEANATIHDTKVYERMKELTKDPNVKGLRVLTILQPREEPKDEAQAAIKKYYDEVIKAVKDPDRLLRYQRAVVLRQSIDKELKEAWVLNDYFSQRDHFSNHVREIYGLKTHADIEFFKDEGRIIDVSFALFFHDHDWESIKVSTLVLEITVRRKKAGHRFMGLLVIDTPKFELANEFNVAFEHLYNGDLDVERITESTVEDILKKYA